MIAAGIDIGGSKIETQVFDQNWKLAEQKRVETPKNYRDLIDAITGMMDWVQGAGGTVPIGIGSAGLINPATDVALTANLPATGHTFIRDIEARSGRRVFFINDCRAMTLSEAIFGAGKGATTVAGLILGTGIGGGVAINGRLMSGSRQIGGEFGHSAAAARVVLANSLPMIHCGCGRVGCVETLIAGPGLTRIVQALCNETHSPVEIAALKETRTDIANAWTVWCDLVAELILSITFALDPDVVVIAGGLSRIKNADTDIALALAAIQFQGYDTPDIRLAQGGDASGARGAAFHAWKETLVG